MKIELKLSHLLGQLLIPIVDIVRSGLESILERLDFCQPLISAVQTPTFLRLLDLYERRNEGCQGR